MLRRASSPTVRIPRAWSFSAVEGPTPHSDSTRRGWRNAVSSPGSTTSRPSGFAARLAIFARTLVRATPTVTARPTCSRASSPQPRGDLRGGARDSLEAADVEKRLFHRQSLDLRRGLLEDLKQALARLDVGGEAWVDDLELGAQPLGPAPAHPTVDAERTRLVAGCHHDPGSDDGRASAKARVVALLDRGEEGVGVGMQDRGLSRHRTYVRIAVK